MITPDDIRRKANNLYKVYLRAWLTGQQFFPRIVPCEKTVDSSVANAAASIQRLKLAAKETRGFGYSIEWERVESRKHGANLFPRKISFETEEDLLRYIGKQQEFALFTSAVEQVRERYPDLGSWIGSNRQLLIDSVAEVDGLLEVVDYLCAHPRPGLFARELPLTVDTKFIERNHRILREWLDRVLQPHAIRADEDHFARRYGLRYAEPHILVRFLDEVVQKAANSVWQECSIPLHALGARPIVAERVFVVENKVNLLTLPQVSRGLAVGGLGNGVTDLRYVPWLANTKIWYWGDIDVDGFAILSRLRIMLPHVQSLLMNESIMFDWRERIGTTGTGLSGEILLNLTPSEQAAYRVCAAENLRIEQEKFPQAFVDNHFQSVFFELGDEGSKREIHP